MRLKHKYYLWYNRYAVYGPPRIRLYTVQDNTIYCVLSRWEWKHARYRCDYYPALGDPRNAARDLNRSPFYKKLPVDRSVK